MISAGLAFALGVVIQEPVERLPRPSDDAMLAQLLERRPGSRVLSIHFSETPRGGGRAACGLIDIGGVIEPFALLAAWQDVQPSVVFREGAPPPLPEPAHWRIVDIAPRHTDRDGDGVLDRGERNTDTLRRKMALDTCERSSPIMPPPGVRWNLEIEREPPRLTE